MTYQLLTIVLSNYADITVPVIAAASTKPALQVSCAAKFMYV